MHSIKDIVAEKYPEIVICDLDMIDSVDQLSENIRTWKNRNNFVFIYSIENFERHKVYLEQVRQNFDKWVFSTPGHHPDKNHVSNLDYLTNFVGHPDQPIVHHKGDKKFNLLFLVGRLHQHRLLLLEALANRNLLRNSLVSLQNPNKAFSHILPDSIELPAEYEWPEISRLGGFKNWKAQPGQTFNDTFLTVFGKLFPNVYRDSICSIVSETNIISNINYITEKTWMPLVAGHLFVLQGNLGNINFLEKLGFQIKNDFIPDYDETNHNMIADICAHICQQKSKHIYIHTKKQRMYNRNLALDEARWIRYHSQQLTLALN